MRILVIDDNVAIQEIIKDILEVEGHFIRLAGSIEDGVGKICTFEPDIIFLEYKMGGQPGLQVLKHKDVLELKNFTPCIILIKTVQDMEPPDEPAIVTSIDKPFRSENIKSALYKAVDRVNEMNADDGKVRKPEPDDSVSSPGLFSRLFRRNVDKQDSKSQVYSQPVGNISFNESYIIFENKPHTIYSFIHEYGSKEYQVMLVTSKNKMEISKNINSENLHIHSMHYSVKDLSRLYGLGTLMHEIHTFIDNHDKPVVLIDNIGQLISENGFDLTLRMLNQLLTAKMKNKRSIVISVPDVNLTDKDKSIFLHNMKEYKRIY